MYLQKHTGLKRGPLGDNRMGRTKRMAFKSTGGTLYIHFRFQSFLKFMKKLCL